jgi:hypothetical protein
VRNRCCGIAHLHRAEAFAVVAKQLGGKYLRFLRGARLAGLRPWTKAGFGFWLLLVLTDQQDIR